MHDWPKHKFIKSKMTHRACGLDFRFQSYLKC